MVLKERKMQMKKRILFALLMLCICLCSRKSISKSENQQPKQQNQPDRPSEIKVEDNKETRRNRRLIEGMIGQKDDDILINILYALNTVNAGELSAATCSKDGPDVYLDVVAEDGRNLRLLLSQNYLLMAVKNLDTGEWLITSQR